MFIFLTFIQLWGQIKFKMNLDIYNKLSTLLNKTTFYKLDLAEFSQIYLQEFTAV